MNPNYFYDLNYQSPHGAVAYEYTKLDPDQKVDYCVFYHDSLIDSGLLDYDGVMLVRKYRDVKVEIPTLPELALEFDCGSKSPACFFKLHPYSGKSQITLDSLCDTFERSRIPLPTISNQLRLVEVGVYPARGLDKFRFMCRGIPSELKKFADSLGCVNTDLITSVSHDPPETTGINFDWNGSSISSVTFHGENVKPEDPWVSEVTQHAEERIAQLYAGKEYKITQYTKVALSADASSDYLKAYFIVREIKR